MILLDICELIVDCPHSTAKDEGHGFPLIRTPNIGKGRLILDNVHRVCKEVYDKRNIRAIPQVDDIILAREAPAGNVALITKGQKVCLGQRTVLIRPNINKVNPEYLVYYMLSPKVQHDLQSSANGATVAHINMPKIRNLKIQIPNRVIQDKIATILSRYDALIENYQKQIKLLEESAQRLYKEWFVDLRFPGHENTKIVDGVPEGWSFIQIKDRYKTVLGGTPSRFINNYWGGDISWINSGEINKLRIINSSEKITKDGYNNSSTKLMPVHTTILAITGATLGQVSYTEIETCANQSVVGIIDEENTTNEYLYLHIYNNINSIINKATGGAQQHINKNIVNDYYIMLPNEDILTEFRRKIKPIFNVIKDYLFTIEKLTEARGRLLPKLMSGEIEV